MYKRFYLFLMLMIITREAVAQNGLQICAERKNKAIQELLDKRQMNDTAGLRKYNELSKKWRECIIGKGIPEFTVGSLTGREISTKDLRGKILVLNFWFIACPPCIAEMPALNRLVSEYKDSGVVFLGITFEKKEDIASKFLSKYKFDFTIIPDAARVEELFGVMDHPVIFIVDREGTVAIAWSGGSTDEAASTEAYLRAKPVIDRLLEKI